MDRDTVKGCYKLFYCQNFFSSIQVLKSKRTKSGKVNHGDNTISRKMSSEFLRMPIKHTINFLKPVLSTHFVSPCKLQAQFFNWFPIYLSNLPKKKNNFLSHRRHKYVTISERHIKVFLLKIVQIRKSYIEVVVVKDRKNWP